MLIFGRYTNFITCRENLLPRLTFSRGIKKAVIVESVARRLYGDVDAAIGNLYRLILLIILFVV